MDRRVVRGHKVTRVIVAVALALAAATSTLEAHKPTKTRFTYHRDVLPIFASRCGSCHREGGVAPMSLLGYQETFPWAVSIKNQVLALSMPPWFADERYGAFRHSSSLTATEVDTIVDWCLGGTPEGDPDDAPARGIVVDRPEGEPDMVLELPETFVLEADRGEARHEALLETGLRRDRFLRSIEFRPERPNAVRSALLFVVPEGSKPVAPAASWVAGEGAEVWLEGRGVRVPAGASLLVRIHYKKTWLDEGKEIRDRSSVALYFSRGKARPIESLVVEARGGEGVYPLSRDVEVVSFLPKVEAPLDSLLLEAALPDGTILPLIRLRRPDPEWPRTYRLEKPISLPKGSRLRVTSTSPQEASLVLSYVARN
jgi:hypothetical protein